MRFCVKKNSHKFTTQADKPYQRASLASYFRISGVVCLLTYMFQNAYKASSHVTLRLRLGRICMSRDHTQVDMENVMY